MQRPFQISRQLFRREVASIIYTTHHSLDFAQKVALFSVEVGIDAVGALLEDALHRLNRGAAGARPSLHPRRQNQPTEAAITSTKPCTGA